MGELLVIFWFHQEVVTRQNGDNGPNFKANQGKTQGGIISPTLFSVVVDNVVRSFLTMTVKDHMVEQEGLVLNVRRCLLVFHVINRRWGKNY